ncbi:MAG: HK97 family major capsid protein [Chloroflexi bacterium OLB13]|nr:MAG: HK97 family major capsid protein [Chloroflexi bacterium OLB13]
MSSKTKIIELRQKRAKLIADARALNEKVQAEGRDFTAEEQQNWDQLMNDADKLRTQYEREERLESVEAELNSSEGAERRPDPEGRGNGERIEFRSRSMRGVEQVNPGWRDLPEWRRLMRTAESSYTAGFRGFLRGQPASAEVRNLQADLDTQGGYLMTPIQMVDQLIKAVDDAVYIRQWATVFAVPNADSLGVPTLESDPADADWTTELATGNEDTAMSLGRRELHPHPLAKRIKISRKLIARVPNSESLVIERLGYKFGITQEKAFLTGSGAQQPLGVFTASPDGIPTSRDEATDNTTTAVSFDGLINAKYKLKGQYWPRARWLAHRDFYKMVVKLVDGNGQYIWRESVRVGEPDMLLGLPTYMSEYAPNTFTASQYAAILGDFSNYWIADDMSLEMQRLVELYAETNQIGLIARLSSDGQPTLPEAFVRVQLAAQ